MTTAAGKIYFWGKRKKRATPTRVPAVPLATGEYPVPKPEARSLIIMFFNKMAPVLVDKIPGGINGINHTDETQGIRQGSDKS